MPPVSRFFRQMKCIGFLDRLSAVRLGFSPRPQSNAARFWFVAVRHAVVLQNRLKYLGDTLAGRLEIGLELGPARVCDFRFEGMEPGLWFVGHVRLSSLNLLTSPKPKGASLKHRRTAHLPVGFPP